MTKIFNFVLEIKGVVGRVAHAKSSDPATPPYFRTCTYCPEAKPHKKRNEKFPVETVMRK